ncbi:hypothetical protein GCK72_017718 [Caenorhabditis remanei]|uniref:G-protein coupled receptors family 1 profile domain-containing protein n=1 Tax=Caenorhabditis remanei TaxID=31234 RepID=A0A6A5G991_CAERE|nr:hypothetical protein GCK72_017718 [Caenorhabditis remanei]KAF1751164.1 hypothetical protein GCK72_017718 [Caenorhabditis remanei]
MFFLLFLFFLVQIFNAHLIKNGEPEPIKTSPLEEIDAEIPPEQKNALYYFVILMFVTSTIVSTLLTGAFLVASIFLWRRFKHISSVVFLLCQTVKFGVATAFLIKRVINTIFGDEPLCINGIDAVICTPFFKKNDSKETSLSEVSAEIPPEDKDGVYYFIVTLPLVYIWMILVWILSGAVVLSMMSKNCRYEYDMAVFEHYVLKCRTESGIAISPSSVIQMIEIAMQFVIPVFILAVYIALVAKICTIKQGAQNNYESTILKQAVFIFALFQISSIVFLLCQTLKFKVATAFLIKRVINTTEIFAGAATPCFFFFTSKDIRKLVTVKVSATSSQNNSNSQQRRLTITAVIPPKDKDAIYYIIVSLFVSATFASTLLTGAFLVMSMIFWKNFKQMKFFWFLTQLTIAVFLMSSLNFLINVPATLFSLITKEFVQTDAFFLMSNVIDFCHNAVLFSNLLIAIHRTCVYFWMLLVWILSGVVVISMMINKCRYEYDSRVFKHYELLCLSEKDTVTGPPSGIQMMEITMQFVIPIFIFVVYIALVIKIFTMTKATQNKYEITILKQTIFIFVLFEISPIVFILCQTVEFETATAFLIKRIINTLIENVPPEEKDWIYYLVITTFVLFTVLSTLLTGTFLLSSVYFWSSFKAMKFFWFLTQLTLSVFILSTLNLVINVPATLFAYLTQDFTKSVFYIAMSYIIDFCHYTILISNLVIAIQRFFVFFFRHLTYRVFDSLIIFGWLLSVWSVSGTVTIIMAMNNCKYNYKKTLKHYVLNCQPLKSVVDLPPPKWIQMLELILQFGIPCLILVMYVAVVIKISIMKKTSLNKNEIRVLIQAIIIFILFQTSSCVFLFCQTLEFNSATAFIIKRLINTIEIFAGAATPCFFFFTSKEIRKLLSTKISAVSSQGNSHVNLDAEVPPNEKGSIYYLVITLFVVSIIASTLLTGAFVVVLILLWGHFKTLKYFWFLSQLTLSVFILSALNLIINVPATLFSLITKDFVSSDIFTILSYTIDYLHYTILISNLVIALQRFSVFFFRQLTYRVFDSYANQHKPQKKRD